MGWVLNRSQQCLIFVTAVVNEVSIILVQVTMFHADSCAIYMEHKLGFEFTFKSVILSEIERTKSHN
jgi:hypothetical protein